MHIYIYLIIYILIVEENIGILCKKKKIKRKVYVLNDFSIFIKFFF